MGRLSRFKSSAGFLRCLFSILRRVAPVVSIQGKVFVLRHDDVIDVLRRQAEFSVIDVYAERMRRTSGDFFLGMDLGPRYRRERSIMNRVLHDGAGGAAGTAGDLQRIRALVRSYVVQIMHGARNRGRIDAVDELTREIPVRLLADYFGVPGPDGATMRRWMRSIFHHLFFDPGNDPQVTKRAVDDAAQLVPYLRGLIDERRRKGAAADTMLDRLIVRQATHPEDCLDDDGIARNIGGVVIGAVDTTSKAAINALGVLMATPTRRWAAHDAARGSDDALLLAHVFEALRFNPFNPIMMRGAARNTTVGQQGKRVELGGKVWVSPLSAMFDREAFDQPRKFSVDRPLSSYLHFGFDTHLCYGQLINRVTLPEILRPLLADASARPMRGRPGKLQWDASEQFPDHWWFEVGRAHG